MFGAQTTRGILGIYTIAAIGPAVYYTYLTIRLLGAHQHYLLNYYSNLKGKRVKWIRNALYWLLMQAIVYTMMRYGPLPVPTAWYVIFGSVSNTAVIYYLSFFGIKQLSLRHEAAPEDTDEEAHATTGDNHSETFAQLEEYLRNSRAYLDPNLTIADLAGALHCSKRTLSRVINGHCDQHFNGYINQFRVETARELLLDARYDHYSMDGIASEAGFNSKATFYYAFKKVSTVSPAAFRRRRNDGEVEAAGQ